jgi:hypothetical protein
MTTRDLNEIERMARDRCSDPGTARSRKWIAGFVIGHRDCERGICSRPLRGDNYDWARGYEAGHETRFAEVVNAALEMAAEIAAELTTPRSARRRIRRFWLESGWDFGRFYELLERRTTANWAYHSRILEVAPTS